MAESVSDFLKSVNIWHSYKQEHDCLVHILRPQQCVGQACKVHETTTLWLVTLPNVLCHSDYSVIPLCEQLRSISWLQQTIVVVVAKNFRCSTGFLKICHAWVVVSVTVIAALLELKDLHFWQMCQDWLTVLEITSNKQTSKLRSLDRCIIKRRCERRSQLHLPDRTQDYSSGSRPVLADRLQQQQDKR